ncbi:MAG: 50S ribosomal protein L20 [Dehalococcoidia bacterium]|nr:50S ribosomal protein L20 [Dehalococcoidia bacterium]
MTRVKGGNTNRKRHKKVLNQVKGHRGSRNRRFRVARESLIHALSYSTIHRKNKKREQRSLAILRINAAARLNGITYGKLIHGLKLSDVTLDRKSLANIAVNDPNAFKEIVDFAKSSLS